MVRTQNSPKPRERGERHSAAWGKRLSLVLLLAIGIASTSMAFGQATTTQLADRSRTLRLLAEAHHGTAKGQTVRVIVQYKQVPTEAHYATMKSRGGLLHAKLHMIKGAAFTIPVSALPKLEADPEIASVSLDHPMKVLDESTDVATGVPSAWSAGYTGAGVTVAVIDSGINDNHPDLRNSNGHLARGLSPGLHGDAHQQLQWR